MSTYAHSLFCLHFLLLTQSFHLSTEILVDYSQLFPMCAPKEL